MATSDEESKAVMHLFRKGRPLTLAQVANKLSWSETRAEWVLTDMCVRGDLVRTKNGKYGLVKKEVPKVPILGPFRYGDLQGRVLDLMSDGNVWRPMDLEGEIPGMTSSRINAVLTRLTELGKIRRSSYGKYVRKDVTVTEEKPKLTSYKRGQLEAKLLEIMADGRVWTAKDLETRCGIAADNIGAGLRRLVERGQVAKIKWGHYIRKDVPLAEGSPLPPTEPQEVEVSAGTPIVGGIEVNVNITCTSLEEARIVMRALAKMKGV